MQVVILCGGLGMRLKEETEYRPKPMVEIGERPILWHIMKIYAHYGFKDFVLCLGYKGEVIKDYFLNYRTMSNDVKVKLGKEIQTEILSNNTEDFEIILADTGQHSMTGARVRNVRKYLDNETFMLTYGDGVGDINIEELLKFHKSHGKIATVTGVSPVPRFGELDIEDDRVTRFSEKPLHFGTLVSGGFFVFNREIFYYLQGGEDLVLEKQPLEQLAAEGQLMVYRHCGFWHPMDTIRDKETLEKLWRRGAAPWKVWK